MWFSCREISGADPSSFEVIQPSEHVPAWRAEVFAFDSRAVYFLGKVIPNADPASYVLLSTAYAKDKNHVWLGTSVIQGADAATFQVLNYSSGCSLRQNPYCPPDAKDSRQSYVSGKVLTGPQ